MKKLSVLSALLLLLGILCLGAPLTELYAADDCLTEGKPLSLTFEYTGGGCSESNHNQGDRAACSGFINSSLPITVATNNSDYVITPTSLDPGDTFTVTDQLGGRLDSNTEFTLTNTGGTEWLRIHTSCSQPLGIGDVFGSLTLVGYFGNGARLGDFVWDDLDSDGIQDAGEPGLEGVVVELTWAGRDDLCGTEDDGTPRMTTTDENGLYEFKVGTSGNYYCVEFVRPTGKIFTYQDQGTDDAVDSDADPYTGEASPIIYLLPLETNHEVDAGIRECIENLSATYVSNGVRLMWTDMGADRYNVYRSTVSGGPYAFKGSTSDGTFLDDTAIPGTTYFYVVRSADSSGEEICQSAEISGLLPEPEEQIDDIIDEFESSVEDGDLVGDGPGGSADGRLVAFGNMLEEAQDYIDAGDFASACEQLEAAHGKCDGTSPPPDFVTGDAAPQMAASIQTLMNTLGCE